jgi:hypothetical protein
MKAVFLELLLLWVLLLLQTVRMNELIVLLDFIHCLVSQKIEELKIYTKYHTTHVHKIHTRVNY